MPGLKIVSKWKILICILYVRFEFIEFRSVQDATLGLTLLDGLTLGGKKLRFGRPVDYKLPEKHLLCYCIGEEEPINLKKEIPYTMPNVEEGTPAYHLGKALMQKVIFFF